MIFIQNPSVGAPSGHRSDSLTRLTWGYLCAWVPAALLKTWVESLLAPICKKSEEYQLPTGHWQALLAGIDITVDHLIDDITALLHEDNADIDDTFIVADLPELYRPLYKPLFPKRFLACMLTVAWKLVAPGAHRLASVAEELALHTVIRSATIHLDEAGVKADFDPLYDLAFEDTDFMFLFDRRFDGIEDSEIGGKLGVANLHFRAGSNRFGSRSQSTGTASRTGAVKRKGSPDDEAPQSCPTRYRPLATPCYISPGGSPTSLVMRGVPAAARVWRHPV